MLAVALAFALLPCAAGQAGPALQPLGRPDWSAYTSREDLTAAGNLSGAQRVLRFVQVSDAHILDDDAPYPLRQEPLDPFIGVYSTSAQRPQEEYTDEVLDSIVRAINLQHAADPLQFVMNTGDNVDNDLENELMRFIDLYAGTSTTQGPLSGMPCQPDGQSNSTSDASQDVTGTCTSLPSNLAVAHAGLAAGLPWYSAFGNHDAMVQGNVNIEPSFDDVAQQVGRHFLHQSETVAMYFPGADSCPAGPGGSPADDFGHGYGFAGERLCDADPDNDGYYAFSVGAVRFVVLDTVNDDFVTENANLQGQFNPQSTSGADLIGGLAEGSVDPAQAAWMDSEIAAHPDSLIVIFSHHTLNSMFTDLAAGDCPPGAPCLADVLQAAGYKTGPQLIADLAQHPNVVAWIGGHTHRNHIEAKSAAGAPRRGFWNVESASLIDWPQEARAIELWVTADGAKAFWRLTDFTHDVAKSRDLEATDPQRVPAAAGEAKDRDTLLWVDVPPGIRLQPLPEAPHEWRIRVLTPLAPVPAGARADLTIAVDDLLHPSGPLPGGLSVHWFPPSAPSAVEPGAMLDLRNLTALPATQNESTLLAHAAFAPSVGGTYYAPVRLQWGETEVAARIVSVEVLDAPAKGKGSPGLPLVFVLAALAVMAVVRRGAV